MATKLAALLPISIKLPGEILFMIAEACIEPYLIKVDIIEPQRTDSINEDDGPPSIEIITHPRLSASSLALVSREFQNGIRKGLRNHFTGYLLFPFPLAKGASEILRGRNLEWIVPMTTHLHVHGQLGGPQPPRFPHQLSGPIFTNIRKLTIITMKKLAGGGTIGDNNNNAADFEHLENTLIRLKFYTNVRGTVMLKALRLRAVPGSCVLLVNTALMSGSRCEIVEVQVSKNGEAKVVGTYDANSEGMACLCCGLEFGCGDRVVYWSDDVDVLPSTSGCSD